MFSVILTKFSVVLHIILCIIVLGIAVVIYQGATQGIWNAYSDGAQMHKRWKGQNFEANNRGLPPPEYVRLGFWRVVPFISVVPSGLAIALLYATVPAPRLILIPPYRWILDVYYPLTWVSKPKGQVLYVLSVMLFQCGTFGHNVAKYCLLYLAFFVGFAVAWCYITPIACWWISNGSYPQGYRRIFRYSWIVATCLLAQIVLRKCLSFRLLPTRLTYHPVTIVVLLIILTISQHIKAGRKEALDHPLCRYNPATARSLRLLPMSQSTVMRSQNATTNTLSVPSNAYPPRYDFSLLASPVESPAGSEVQSTQQHQVLAARAGTAPSTVSESESAR